MHCRHISYCSVGGTNTGRGPTAIKVRPLGNTRLRQTNELPEVRGFVSVRYSVDAALLISSTVLIDQLRLYSVLHAYL